MEALRIAFCNVGFLCGNADSSWWGMASIGIGIVILAFLILDHVAKSFFK
jgi:hypothetical protein